MKANESLQVEASVTTYFSELLHKVELQETVHTKCSQNFYATVTLNIPDLFPLMFLTFGNDSINVGLYLTEQGQGH